MMTSFTTLLLSTLVGTRVSAFPQHRSLAGLTEEELDTIIPRLTLAYPPPPGPLNDASAKLVNDAAHPWQPQRGGEIRSPCPGLNTLGAHGASLEIYVIIYSYTQLYFQWLPRSGVATPGQIVQTVQQGFNMGNDLTVFVTYAAFLVDGNPIKNLMSIGGKTFLTGINPPRPASVAGLDTQALVANPSLGNSTDAFFGDNRSFNETLFDQFVDLNNRLSSGKYNLSVASEYRVHRIQDSITTNPQFSFVSPRYFTAYVESMFPFLFFVDGRVNDAQLSPDVARSFFQDSKMPKGFLRTQPGKATLYYNFVNQTVKGLYPNPTGLLREALKKNLEYFFEPLKAGTAGCTQLFPYGQ
ncbi:hypothetical protein M422DRAFT_244362 [Sphaerobolus stellatus SS14]|nr:hypothetical protein M422DRAFT_244362 [Sphaerobolus stellatus SS14]